MGRQRNEMDVFHPGGRGIERLGYSTPVSEGRSMGARDLLSVFFRNKKMVLAIFVVTVLVVTVRTLLLTPTYEAKSSLMVKFGREYGNRPGATESHTFMSVTQEEMLNSEIQILTSADLVEKVLAAMKVETVYPSISKQPPPKMTPMQAAVGAALKKVRVEAIKKSNVIEVAFQHHNPKVAARFVNLLVDFYKEKHLQVFSDPQSTFIVNKLAQYEQKLKDSEERMEAYKQKNQVFAWEEQRTFFLKQRVDMDSALRTTQSQVEELEKKVRSLAGQRDARSKDLSAYTTTERDKIITDARARLLELQLKEHNLLKQYNPDNRLVRDVQEEIALVKKYLREQEADISSKVRTGNPVFQEVEKELIRARADWNSQVAKAAALKAQLANVDKDIKAFDMHGNEYQGLRRELESNDKFYRIYLEHLEEARISEEMNRQKMANVGVIQTAAPPLAKIKPKVKLNILFGIVIGIMLSVGYLLLVENMSQRFLTPENAERGLGLPVLTTVLFKE